MRRRNVFGTTCDLNIPYDTLKLKFRPICANTCDFNGTELKNKPKSEIDHGMVNYRKSFNVDNDTVLFNIAKNNSANLANDANSLTPKPSLMSSSFHALPLNSEKFSLRSKYYTNALSRSYNNKAPSSINQVSWSNYGNSLNHHSPPSPIHITSVPQVKTFPPPWRPFYPKPNHTKALVNNPENLSATESPELKVPIQNECIINVKEMTLDQRSLELSPSPPVINQTYNNYSYSTRHKLPPVFEPKYTDPVPGATNSFLQRITELGSLENETVRWEKSRRARRKAKQDTDS